MKERSVMTASKRRTLIIQFEGDMRHCQSSTASITIIVRGKGMARVCQISFYGIHSLKGAVS